MAFKTLVFEKLWTDKDKFPTYESSEAQVRADMQYHPDAILDYINNTLLKELEAPTAAANIGDEQEGTLAATLTEIFDHLAASDEEIRKLGLGDAPDAVRAAKVSFTSPGWVQDSETGLYELRIIQSKHTRLSDAFGYSLKSLEDEAYYANTWATACTNVVYEEESTDIVLTAENAYDGAIVFFGV